MTGEEIGQSTHDTDRSVSWQYGPAEQQHIRDANRADDRPDDLTFDVDDGEVIATGPAESIRWLYDYLHYLKRAWRKEGEQWDADAAEEMADSLYEQVGVELPERQRNKKAMTDGGQVKDGTDRSDEPDEEEMSIATADAMVPKTWDEICGQTEEDSLRL